MNSDDRRRKLEAVRAQQRAAQRRPFIISGVVGLVIVIVAAVGIILWVRAPQAGEGVASAGPSQIIPSSPTGPTTRQATTNRAPDNSGIAGVLAWDTTGWPGDGADHPGALQHDHVTGPVAYAQTPPVGGPHSPIWMNAGVYTKPIPSERAVHNLEHGAVWITYRPDVPAAEVNQLVEFVGRQSLIDESAATGISGQESRYIDLSPWSTNALPGADRVDCVGPPAGGEQPDRPADAAVRRHVPAQPDLHARVRSRRRRRAGPDRGKAGSLRCDRAEPSRNGHRPAGVR